MTQESLRRAIGVVGQDTSLLHRSVRENIKIGRWEASDAEMMAAAEQRERARRHPAASSTRRAAPATTPMSASAA